MGVYNVRSLEVVFVEGGKSVANVALQEIHTSG